MNKYHWLLCFTLVFYFATAEDNWLSVYKQKYPGEDAVILQNTQTVIITLNHNKPLVQCLDTAVLGFMSNQVSEARNFQVYHSYLSQIDDLNVYSMVSIKNKPEKIKVDKFDRRSNLSRSIFYDDTEEISFTFAGVNEGAQSFVTYREDIRDPFYIPAFNFSADLPVVKSVYRVSFPPSVKIHYHLFNIDSSKVQFTTSATAKGNIYTWQMEQVSAIHHEENGADEDYYQPHIIITIDEVAGEKFLSDYHQLAKWCSSFVKDLNHKPDAELQAIVTGLTTGVSSPVEKCHKIYEWVQQNITYVAFEDSINGFRPREGADVCRKRYGDCKDMASLLYTMCRTAGINAYYTWIGTNDKPYNHYDIATPILYNHMICLADIDGRKIVLDGTGKFSPFGYPTDFIQNKEAMYIDDDGKPSVYKLPEVDAAVNFRSDSVSLVLDSANTLSGTLKNVLNGYRKADYLYITKYHGTPETQKKLFQIGNNKFQINSITQYGFDVNDGTGESEIKFNLPDYVIRTGEKMYVNLNLNKRAPEQKVANPASVIPRVFDYKHTDRSFVKFKIPDGYEVDFLPDEASYTDSLISYHIRYTSDKNYITYTSNIDVNCILLTADKFLKWNAALSKFDKAVSENIVLRQTKN